MGSRIIRKESNISQNDANYIKNQRNKIFPKKYNEWRS